MTAKKAHFTSNNDAKCAFSPPNNYTQSIIFDRLYQKSLAPMLQLGEICFIVSPCLLGWELLA